MAGKWHQDSFSKEKWGDIGVTANKPGSQGGKVDPYNLLSLAPTESGAGASQKSFDTRKIKEINNMEFITPLSDEFKCPVCLSLMNEPQLTTCGHRFCKSCIEPLVREQPMSQCPVCNQNRFGAMTDRAFERKIKALSIYCVNREAGCEWVGDLVSLDHHMEKQCCFVFVVCAFESFGCTARVLRRDLDAHVSDMVSHMTLVVNQFEAQQRSFDRLLQEKDAKIRQLEQHIDQVEANIERELSKKSNVRWTPLDPCHKLFLVCAGTPRGIKQCHVPENVVPSNAKEILILLAVHSGGSTPLSSPQCITLFVEESGVRYAKYIMVTPHRQDAWNDNTDNVWLPMPTSRLVHVDVPIEFGKNFWSDVLLIGYR